MFSFNNIVTNILLEAAPTPGVTGTAGQTQNQTNPSGTQQTSPVPQWFEDILKKHTEIISPVTDNDVENLFIVANKKPRPSSAEVRNVIQAVRIVDIIRRLINIMPDPKPKTYTDFLNKLKEQKVTQEGQNILNKIQNLDNTTKYTWEIQDSDIRNQYNIARAENDKAAAVALATYNRLSILEATIQIVKRRTDVWNRIAKLKSPIQPFTNLITDIFMYPEQYMAGQKKVTSDFNEIVDGLYPQSLFKVGLAAKELFEAEIGRLKMAQQTENISPAAGAEGEAAAANTAGVADVMGDNLSLFNKYFNSVLINEKGLIPTLTQGVQRGVKLLRQGERLAQDPKYRQRYQEIRKKLKQDIANRLKFIKNEQVEYRKVDANDKETQETGKTAPNQYTIGNITKMETTEAINLITALRNIAEYVRKGVGAGERLKYAGQAGSALAGIGGAKLYG